MNEQKPCGCGRNNLAASAFDAFEVLAPGCTPTVSKEVCVEANVTIAPTVEAGTPIVNCVGGPSLSTCREQGFEPSQNGLCTFSVSQVLCVNVPIHFDAQARVVRGTVACGTTFPEGNCPDEPITGCTRTRGFYATHEEVTNMLLEEAGGEIILGIDNLGFSLLVNAANIDAVVGGTSPGTPSPQYQQLYTQLLTANLNVLSGAGCPYATNFINIANNFLTQAQNDSMASTIQEALALYNEGLAPGCPEHCA